MSDPVAQDNGHAGSDKDQNQPQALKADLATQGTITLPQVTQPNTPQQEAKDNNQRRNPIFHRASVIGSFAFSAALVVVASLQLCVYSQQSQIMAASQRAYINIIGLDIRRILNDRNTQISWNILPIIENSGNSPTKNLRWAATYHDIDPNFDPNHPRAPLMEDLKNATANRGTFGAHQKGSIFAINEIIDFALTERIQSQTIRPYIHGVFVYEDFFTTDTHITRYCYFLWGSGQDGFSYSFCPGTTNCTDQECGRDDQEAAKLFKPTE